MNGKEKRQRTAGQGGERTVMTEKCEYKCTCSATDKAALLEDAVLSLCARLTGEGTGARARILEDTARGIVRSCAKADAVGRCGGVNTATSESFLRDALCACVELQARLGALAEARPMRTVRGEGDGCLRLVPCVSEKAVDAVIDRVESVTGLLEEALRENRRMQRAHGRRARLSAGIGRADSAFALRRAARRARGR